MQYKEQQQKQLKALQGDNSDGNAIFLGTSNSLGTRAPNLVGIGGFSVLNAIWNVLVDGLLDDAVDFGDLYLGGAVSATQLSVTAASRFAETGIPGLKGGGYDEGVTFDKPEGAMPGALKLITGLTLAQKNITLGGNEIIELMYNLVTATDFVLKYNSNGFYNRFKPSLPDSVFRTKNFDSNYIGSSFQTFDGTKYKINNLFRPSTVAVSTEKSLPLRIDTPEDYSRFSLGGYVKGDGSVRDTGNKPYEKLW